MDKLKSAIIGDSEMNGDADSKDAVTAVELGSEAVCWPHIDAFMYCISPPAQVGSQTLQRVLLVFFFFLDF